MLSRDFHSPGSRGEEKRQAGARLTPKPNRRLERPPSQANADALLAHDRRRRCGRLLVSVDSLPSVPFDQQY
jgi:hypothetical protein